VTIESNVVVISIVLQAGGNLMNDASCFALHLLFIQLMAANVTQPAEAAKQLNSINQ
jgi:hypothetical protein